MLILRRKRAIIASTPKIGCISSHKRDMRKKSENFFSLLILKIPKRPSLDFQAQYSQRYETLQDRIFTYPIKNVLVFCLALSIMFFANFAKFSWNIGKCFFQNNNFLIVLRIKCSTPLGKYIRNLPFQPVKNMTGLFYWI